MADREVTFKALPDGAHEVVGGADDGALVPSVAEIIAKHELRESILARVKLLLAIYDSLG